MPASFDEEARELTLEAAAAAGLKHVTLLEEPQAAFYAWIDGLGESWRRRVAVGDLILVCDVGGGTTDFSLITVADRDGDLALERIAVGEHILLGGDNMDLALARLLQQRLEAAGHKVDTWQLHGLVASVPAGQGSAPHRSLAARAAGHAPRPRLETDRRLGHDDADPGRCESGAGGRVLPGCGERATCRPGSVASACRSSGCRMPRTRP